MTKHIRRHGRSLSSLTLVLFLALGAFVWFGGSAAAFSTDPNSGIFTGTSDSGNFQEALENAVSAAATAAGCCDIRIAYEVLETTGEYGGFLFINETTVKIYAKW